MTSPHFHETNLGRQHYAMLERNLGRIATALEALVELNDNVASDHLAALRDEVDGMLPVDGMPPRRIEAGEGLDVGLPATAPQFPFRNLTPDEEDEFRAWARGNYEPREEINPMWHWVVRDECDRINEDLDAEGQACDFCGGAGQLGAGYDCDRCDGSGRK